MNNFPPDFRFGAYTSPGYLGTDSPFALNLNNPFYFFSDDGTYKIITNEWERIGKWWFIENQFYIQMENDKEFHFSYHLENDSSEFIFTLKLMRDKTPYAMKFIRDLRFTESKLSNIK